MKNWNNLANNAQLWFYTANKPYSEKDAVAITNLLTAYCNSWMAHGKKVNAGYQFIDNQILILATDKSMEPLSGCSIDDSIAFIKEIDSKFGGDVFNRMRAYIKGENTNYALNSIEIKEALSQGELSSKTLVYNTFAKDLNAFNNQPWVPLDSTWLSRFL